MQLLLITQFRIIFLLPQILHNLPKGKNLSTLYKLDLYHFDFYNNSLLNSYHPKSLLTFTISLFPYLELTSFLLLGSRNYLKNIWAVYTKSFPP
ncbi:Hypothetical protein BHO_0900094 (plasmid) [Borrelia hermsii YBT]|uniref:Uncharacterized protein n=1 Tax=Borrelia hermsii YBT TaxID=1313295 RepID=W5T2K6_BORHE|nr:Hypothetical protein BHO_0900083 [Borrelia hermsii YBT]AHH13471.1 Hypothetical protein BHO_0900088 [Borrelia hermsii YBT]AHH13477.1 Hypothetical protein BHO_0900094 [Borrelia hermsii YBT]